MTSPPSTPAARLPASVDGVLVPAAAATVPATDDGLLRGDGVYEVVRVYGGRPFLLAEHLERLDRSCRALRLDFPRGLVEADVERLLREGAAGTTCDLRIVLTRGGRRLCLLEPPRKVGGLLRLRFVAYQPSVVLDGAKTLSYAPNMLASRLARESGYDEALLVTPAGRVLEAPTASFFWVAGDGRIRTPPLDEHILASITRDVLLELLDVEETPCARDDALSCVEAFLASTTREVQPVAAIEEHELDAPGPATRRAMEAFAQWILGTTGQSAWNIAGDGSRSEATA